jgi:hypothetical protein
MTLPEHAICSLMIAEFGVRQRFGLQGVLVFVAAGRGRSRIDFTGGTFSRAGRELRTNTAAS